MRFCYEVGDACLQNAMFYKMHDVCAMWYREYHFLMHLQDSLLLVFEIPVLALHTPGCNALHLPKYITDSISYWDWVWTSESIGRGSPPHLSNQLPLFNAYLINILFCSFDLLLGWVYITWCSRIALKLRKLNNFVLCLIELLNERLC